MTDNSKICLFLNTLKHSSTDEIKYIYNFKNSIQYKSLKYAYLELNDLVQADCIHPELHNIQKLWIEINTQISNISDLYKQLESDSKTENPVYIQLETLMNRLFEFYLIDSLDSNVYCNKIDLLILNILQFKSSEYLLNHFTEKFNKFLEQCKAEI
jgi:hypothetical protein